MNVLISPLSDAGYLYPAMAVGLELRRRGDCVYVLGRDSATETAAAAGLPSMSAAGFGMPRAFSAGRWFKEGRGQFKAVVRAARIVQADIIVTSVLCHGALLAAEVLDVPAAVLGLAAHLWTYADADSDSDARRQREHQCLARYQQVRQEVGLPPRRMGASPAAPLFGAALLLRGDVELEEPRAVLPANVHIIGPCFWEPSTARSDLDEIDVQLRRTGKPVVYVHLGRYFGGSSLWPTLSSAFAGGPYQAVVEQGRSANPDPAYDRAPDLIRLRRPWMLPLIDRADLVLTNATSAPVLGALIRSRPILVAPDGSEQPLLARACVRAGVAKALRDHSAGLDGRAIACADRDPPARRRRATAVAAMNAVLSDGHLRARARCLGAKMAAADGPSAAADIVYRAATGRARVGTSAVHA